jgi:hypothetical protein
MMQHSLSSQEFISMYLHLESFPEKNKIKVYFDDQIKNLTSKISRVIHRLFVFNYK